MWAAAVLSFGVLVGAVLPASASPAARLPTPSNGSASGLAEYPFPCDNPPIQWMCNTTEFCTAANRMKEDGCWFMPMYCQPRCYADIKTLAHTDCVEHPGESPFLDRIADQVEEQLRCVTFDLLCFFGVVGSVCVGQCVWGGVCVGKSIIVFLCNRTHTPSF